MKRSEIKIKMSDAKGRIDIEVRMHDGENAKGTSYGAILRKPTWIDDNCERAVVSVGGQRLPLHEPWGTNGMAHVYVTALPRDMDGYGYG